MKLCADGDDNRADGWQDGREERPLNLRLATRDDLPSLRRLMDEAIARLQAAYLSPELVEASRLIMGLDTQLIEDGTYFAVESAGEIVGCGGWSRRATLFGGDHSPGRDASLLDPRTDAARVRAMYTHPSQVRRGVGRSILGACEAAMAREGFRRCELAATLAGEPLYRACGYRQVERFFAATPLGIDVPLVLMAKDIEITDLSSPGED